MSVVQTGSGAEALAGLDGAAQSTEFIGEAEAAVSWEELSAFWPLHVVFVGNFSFEDKYCVVKGSYRKESPFGNLDRDFYIGGEVYAKWECRASFASQANCASATLQTNVHVLYLNGFFSTSAFKKSVLWFEPNL